MKTACVLATSSKVFSWGKKTDVFRVVTKHVSNAKAFQGRSEMIIAIVEAMTDDQLRSQFALFFKDGHEGPVATLRNKLYEVLCVAKHGSSATDKFTVWNKKNNVMVYLYKEVIQTVEDTFHKSGSNTFAKWVGLVIDQSKDVNYIERSKDIQKWIVNQHFQMLRKVDLDFVIDAGNALTDETKSTNVKEAVRKVVDIFQTIRETNATVVVSNNDKMLWLLNSDTDGNAVNDVEMTDVNRNKVVDSTKRIVTPSRDDQPMKKMKVGDEPKLGRSLFSENDIGDETGKLLNSSDRRSDTSVCDKYVDRSVDTLDTLESIKDVQDTVVEVLTAHKMQGITENNTSLKKTSVEGIVDNSNTLEEMEGGEKIPNTLLVEQQVQGSSGGPSLSAYEQYLELKKKFEPASHSVAKVVIDGYSSAVVGPSK